MSRPFSTRCADAAALAVAAALLAGCSGPQSALDPHGPDAQSSLTLTIVMTAGGAAIFVLVMALTAVAVLSPARGRRGLGAPAAIIAGGIALPSVTLTALLIYGLLVARQSGGAPGEPLRIEVTGEQFWWRVRYPAGDESAAFETANEIRIPTGRPVVLDLISADVIHSFWVPALGGKLDMIPGRTNTLRLQADRPGIYRGQCTEYCGAQHANMAFFVVAEEPAAFAAWRAAATQALRTPELPQLSRGRALFLAVGCGACHTIRGTEARGTLGPDLTGIGARTSLAAGMFPVNAGTLAGWIASSQHLKPGNRMPSFDTLSGADLRAIAAYLESLK